MKKSSFPLDFLTGRHNPDLLIHPEIGVPVHRKVIQPFLFLRKEAAKEGFDLRPLSGHRSFERQLNIWNEKALGRRPLWDSQGLSLLDFSLLTQQELAMAILRWSALPGTSRHHWGTDLDIIDANAVPKGYQVQLIPEEVNPNGMFGPLHHWLDEAIDNNQSFGIFRPYETDRGGVSPERWHISFFPLAHEILEAYTFPIFEQHVQGSEWELKQTVLDMAPLIYEKFLKNIDSPPFTDTL